LIIISSQQNHIPQSFSYTGAMFMKPSREKVQAFLESHLGEEFTAYRWFLLPLLLSSDEELARILSRPVSEASMIRNAMLGEFKQPFEIFPRAAIEALAQQSPASRVPIHDAGNLDTMLDGGLERGRIYQVFGRSLSGKTEFCYCAIKTFINENAGRATKILVIDSEHSFRPERLLQISDGNVDLNKISVATCYSSPHMIALLQNIEKMFDSGLKCPLLVIDSIMPASFQLYQDEPAKRQQMLLVTAEKLWAMSRNHGTCIIFTNHAAGNLPLPSSGNLLLEYSDYAIYMQKNEYDETIHDAMVIKALNSPEKSGKFRITSKGITYPV
jgi:RecA/RadA recombinase